MRTAAAFALLSASLASAQRGDVKGEAQPPLREEWRVPTPKALSAEEELATFRVDAGLRVELVACEPLVRDPVCASFDERGRLFVCEMSGYMRDVDGTNESEPCGAVVVLSDLDGDGRMDKRDEFLTGLVLPRAVAPTRGGALVIAPPNLLFARDSDGDGRADDVRVMDNGLAGIASPEHAINGLLYGLDNWFWCANAPVRYRWNGERLEKGRTAGSGQWGITEDRWGRIFTNDNSNPLRCDLYPSNYAVRNPALGVAPGMNVNVAKGARPHPSHLTPGVNRGYRDGLLADGRLNEFTGACAPWIYEGDALPASYRGNAFVCEPCGNLVHRFEIASDEKGYPKATTAPPDGAFLTSTDERFRPVFLNEGPDGALYVVDLYRGVIQHKLFVTSWLRAQVKERELEAPLGRGRIWRVTSGERRKPAVDLATCSWSELARRFDREDRWERKQAQRLFVEQGDAVAIEVLREHARDATRPRESRIHALWALDGLGVVDRPALAALLEPCPAPPYAIGLLARPAAIDPAGWAAVIAEYATPDLGSSHGPADCKPPKDQVWQALAVLGDSTDTAAMAELVRPAWWYCDDEIARGAALSGLAGREMELLTTTASGGVLVLADAKERLSAELAACIFRRGREAEMARVLDWIVAGDVKFERQLALAEGALRSRPKDASGKPAPIRLEQRPRAIDWFAKRHPDNRTVAELFDALVWRGKPGSEGLFPRELTEAERARFERGQALFEQTCASCHQLSGLGDILLAPPLRDSPYVLGDAERLTKIVAHGLRGRIDMNGMSWDGEMPGYVASDEDLAAVLTYLRRAWNHAADPIEPDFVRSVRAKHAERRSAWSLDELASGAK
jgi:mono/diheme cytochrome c family protein/glucose/arabinose dehydrogenase